MLKKVEYCISPDKEGDFMLLAALAKIKEQTIITSLTRR